MNRLGLCLMVWKMTCQTPGQGLWQALKQRITPKQVLPHPQDIGQILIQVLVFTGIWFLVSLQVLGPAIIVVASTALAAIRNGMALAATAMSATAVPGICL